MRPSVRTRLVPTCITAAVLAGAVVAAWEGSEILGAQSPPLVVMPSAEVVKFAEARPMPPMPAIARAARVRATVVFRVQISPAGRVADLIEVQGHPMLSTAVADTVARWQF